MDVLTYVLEWGTFIAKVVAFYSIYYGSYFLSFSIATLLVIIIFRWTYHECNYRIYEWRIKHIRMDGRTVVITGASDGIGKAVAKRLAEKGARVIMASRDLNKTEKAAAEIRACTKNMDVHARSLKLDDLKDVAAFAEHLKQSEQYINVLINNAGTYLPTREITVDGYERTFATNYLGHFLLTRLLSDLLSVYADSRVINVTDIDHRRCVRLQCDDLNFQRRPYHGGFAYAQSKLCQIIYSRELARRMLRTVISVNSVHPGSAVTKLYDKVPGSFSVRFRLALRKAFAKDPNNAAQGIMQLAVGRPSRRVTGHYFEGCKLAVCSRMANDRTLADNLWTKTEEMLKNYLPRVEGPNAGN